MLLHHGPARPASIGAATALAILTDATCRLDALRLDAEREIVEHGRSRGRIEALIERLIAGLDAEDADDEDREDFEEGDTLDHHGEAVNEDGDALDVGELDILDGPETTAPETYGRDLADVEPLQPTRRIRRASPRPALFISWKSGRCTSAAFVPSEGRAGA